MKITFISRRDLDQLKVNLGTWYVHFQEDTNKNIVDKFVAPFFKDTNFQEVEDFELDMSDPQGFRTDFENVKRVYGNLSFLTDSQAADERIWAALCIGSFWKYVQYRWNNNNSNMVKQHFLFASDPIYEQSADIDDSISTSSDTSTTDDKRLSPRRALTRNALSRLWWIGRLTYDKERKENGGNGYELTKFVCEHSDNIMHIVERNTISNNHMIMRAFIEALMEAKTQGYKVDTDVVGKLAAYVNTLGGVYILDCLPESTIKQKVLDRAKEIAKVVQKT